ncbi:MAG: WD40 repeat domain-containing protein [Planctomycetaceae bacterium]|nr:WD40 repeat domain-containing protein [Planctomycetaceae bacterium]
MCRVLCCLTAVFIAIGANTLAAQDKPAQAIKVRLLDTTALVGSHNCFLSDDGKFDLIGEGEPGQKTRWSLWNVTEGKLVRFLSAEKGKGTAPYAGDDKADFGAKIDFDGRLDAVSFSTDGKLVVGLARPVLVWEVATGKLLHELENRGHHHHTFRFVDDRHIAAKFQGGTGVELIDALAGERKTLLEPTNFESYGGGVHGDDFTLVSVFEIYSLSLKTGRRTSRAAIPPGSSRFAPSASWYTRDGSKFLIQREGRVEVWDTATWTRQGDTSYVEDNKSQDIKGIARAAGLLAIAQPGTLELWDAVSGGMRTLVVLPTQRSQLCALSADASRMIVSRERAGAVVIEFDGTPETGAIDVAGKIDEQKPQPTR